MHVVAHTSPQRAPLIAFAITTLIAALGPLHIRAVDIGVALMAAPVVAALLFRAAARATAPARGVWVLLGLHMALIGAADITNMVTGWLGSGDMPFTVSDALYLAAYLPWVIAIGRVAIQAPDARLQDVLIDATAIAVVSGLAIFQLLVIGPDGTGGNFWTVGAYPTADVLLVGSLAVMVFARIKVTVAVGLLMAYGVATLALDLGVMWANTSLSAPTWLVPAADTGYTLAYGLLASAALYVRGLEVVARSVTRHGSAPRLTLLGLAVILAPALAVVLAVANQRLWMPFLVGAALAVSLLVMVRLTSLVRRLEIEQRRLSSTEAHLAFQATHDALTGLPNRSLLTERLAQEVASAHVEQRDLALMFIDVDDFKLVNDTLGHAAGDDLLRTVAHRIQDEVVAGDLVARVGGDEFVVVSPNLADRRSAWRFSEAVLAAVCAPIAVGSQIIEPSVSIGVALRGALTDPQALLANADLALYKAKDAGRSCARLFDQSLRLAAHERAGIERGLRRALGAGEIGVEYQPRVRLSDGKVDSLEVLARWPHRPDIAVSRFIEVAEDSGIVEQLGREVLARACDDIMRINRSRVDDPIGVSVNVSMRQLMQSDLVDIVAATLTASGMPRDLLTLEITETFVAREPDIAVHTLSEIHRLGVRLEIDDFGVGHTSFKSLSNLPIDGIKIDRSLAHGLRVHDATAQIVKAIVAMAHALDMQTTVEGIETVDDMEVVRELGCDLGQGFLFSRPIPFDTADRLIATWPGLCPAAADLAATARVRLR